KLDEGIKEGRFQTEFGTKGKFLTEEEKEDVQKLELPGIYLMENASRYYPNGMFASHIIGFAKNEGKDNDIVGKAGMEKEENKLDEGIKEGRFQTEFGTKGKFLTEEEKEDVQKLELPGIYLMENASRYYPNGMFASHIIGFAKNEGKDNDIVGKAGMEKEENKL